MQKNGMNEIEKGIYEHFKGKRYEVVDLARHSETQEMMVIYKALYQGDFPEGLLWVRPLAMFQEKVSVQGKLVPRFKKSNSSMKNKRFFKPKDKSFRKVILLSRFKAREQAEAAVTRLKQDGIPADLQEDQAFSPEPFSVWVWQEAKQAALKLLSRER